VRGKESHLVRVRGDQGSSSKKQNLLSRFSICGASGSKHFSIERNLLTAQKYAGNLNYQLSKDRGGRGKLDFGYYFYAFIPISAHRTRREGLRLAMRGPNWWSTGFALATRSTEEKGGGTLFAQGTLSTIIRGEERSASFLDTL